MNNNIKNIVKMFSVAVCGAMFLASCTDTWDEHFGNSSTNGSNGLSTLEYLKANASDFAEVLTASGYDLSSSQMLTILAPANGTFDKAKYLDMIAAGEKDDVITQFIKNHIILYNISLNNEDRDVYLLNEKRIHFGTLEDMKIQGVDVNEANIICENGIVHILSGDVEYELNLFERLRENYKQYLADNGLEDDPTIISFYNFIRKYDTDSLDPNRSVEFGQDEDGNVIYSDSFMVHNNRVLRSLDSYLFREDSSYWVIDPGVVNYQLFYNEARKYYNFNVALAGEETIRDSISDYLANYATIKELLFNANKNKAVVGEGNALSSEGDSMITTSFTKRYWRLHNYQSAFSGDGIFANVQDVQKASNGYVFTLPEPQDEVVDEETTITKSTMPVSIYNSVFQDIKIEAFRSTIVPRVGRSNATQEWSQEATFNAYDSSTSNDSVSNGYLRVQGPQSSSTPTLSFMLSNYLSGKYDIYISFLPWTVYNPDVAITSLAPVKFKAGLFEADEQNEIPYLGTSAGYDNFTPASTNYVQPWVNKPLTKIDTVFVGTHEFKYCYAHTGTSGAYLKLTLSRTYAERTSGKFDNKFLIDFILLVPHEEGVDPKKRYQPITKDGDDE